MLGDGAGASIITSDNGGPHGFVRWIATGWTDGVPHHAAFKDCLGIMELSRQHLCRRRLYLSAHVCVCSCSA